MGKRKKVNTLTKIDPNTLIPKPLTALSQHESCGGARVTTAVHPVLPSTPAPPPEPPIFSADPSNFTDEYLNDEENVEHVSEGYFAVQLYFCGSLACSGSF